MDEGREGAEGVARRLVLSLKGARGAGLGLSGEVGGVAELIVGREGMDTEDRS